MRNVVALAVVATVLAACSSLKMSPVDPLAGGFVVFESYRVETDWGYKLEGIYIDTDGVVWRYQRDEPWYPKEQRATVVSEADLLKKFAGAEEVGAIDPMVLAEKAGLIEPAGKGRVARGTPSMERSGSLDVAYAYAPRTGNFNAIFLRGTGDWAARNSSPEAGELVRWLDGVKKRVGFEQ